MGALWRPGACRGWGRGGVMRAGLVLVWSGVRPVRRLGRFGGRRMRPPPGGRLPLRGPAGFAARAGAVVRLLLRAGRGAGRGGLALGSPVPPEHGELPGRAVLGHAGTGVLAREAPEGAAPPHQRLGAPPAPVHRGLHPPSPERDVQVPGAGLVLWTDGHRMLRDGRRRSLVFARMSRCRVDLSHGEFVAATGMVTRLELGLISWFGESVPDPSENWDASRRWREIERRIARLRWVAEEDAREFSGIKGIFNRILGRRRLGGKEMYEKMVAEADWMVTAMRAGRDDADVISEVVNYVGLGSGTPALPGR